jgi:hypothetical protein
LKESLHKYHAGSADTRRHPGTNAVNAALEILSGWSRFDAMNLQTKHDTLQFITFVYLAPGKARIVTNIIFDFFAQPFRYSQQTYSVNSGQKQSPELCQCASQNPLH